MHFRFTDNNGLQKFMIIFFLNEQNKFKKLEVVETEYISKNSVKGK
jgi:hypothetical protein